MKRIILCADDYGLNASVSQGIIDLLRRGRLTATSCMTTAQEWSLHAPLLKPFKGLADIGLHFNLTEGKALSPAFANRYGASFLSHPQVIIRSFLHQFDADIIEQECEAQLNQFVAELGFLPDFIDGHQHVHQLPVIREVVVRVFDRHLKGRNAYIRSTYKDAQAPGLINKIKQFIIYLCGASGMQKLLKKYHIAHNAVFSGIYSFNKADQYSQIFPRFLAASGDLGLIMCHPGLPENKDETDVIGASRAQEYRYLASDRFAEDCQRQGVRLVKGVDSLYFSGTISAHPTSV